MINGLDQNQIIAVSLNLSVLVVSLIVSGILIWKIKFDDKNYKLLFIIYTLYWIAPMLLREYTSQMHIAMSNAEWTTSSLLWAPVTVYGIIGLFWKPLNDLLSHRLKSRKNVIYIALAIQLVGTIPMIAYPCFATNIFQSITVGIGASGIAVFNLMFNEQYAKKKIFVTVSLLSLPPLIAEFVSSVLQCCVTSLLKPGEIKSDPVHYINTVKFMWVIGLICIVGTIVATIFLKEKTALLYKDNEYKEQVNNKWDGWVVALLILCAAITSFIKFTTSGSTAITELSYIGDHQGISTSGYEGYLSVIFTVGQMAANILCGLLLVKRLSKLTIFSIATGLWIVFAIIQASVLNVYARLPLNLINGFAFGFTYNIIVGLVMNKYFSKTNKITPITLYNLGLSIGICSSQFFNTFMKEDVFAWDPETQQYLLSWEDFIRINWIVIGCVIATMVVMWAMFAGAHFITKKHPPQKVLVNRVKNQTDMDD